MPMATITARVDAADKTAFDDFCANVGLNASAAINIYVKTVLREHRIPFDITNRTDPFWSPANQQYITKSVRELRSGKGTAHELIEVDDV